MNQVSAIIGIGGNESRPNPRLPAYIIRSLVREEVDKIILVSSVDSAKKTSKSPNLVSFNTSQKLKLLDQFANTFFPEKNTFIDLHRNSNIYTNNVWIKLWEKAGEYISEEKQVMILKTLKRYNKCSNNIDLAKIYAVRHAIWFFDISFRKIPYSNLESIGGETEEIFNTIRNVVYSLELNELEDIFQREVFKNKVNKIILPCESKVVPYSEATKKLGRKKLSSIEPNSILIEDYLGEYQSKAKLYKDIELIFNYIPKEEYEIFWDDFNTSYRNDLNDFIRNS